jgi:hypothetical protein
MNTRSTFFSRLEPLITLVGPGVKDFVGAWDIVGGGGVGLLVGAGAGLSLGSLVVFGNNVVGLGVGVFVGALVVCRDRICAVLKQPYSVWLVLQNLQIVFPCRGLRDRSDYQVLFFSNLSAKMTTNLTRAKMSTNLTLASL